MSGITCVSESNLPISLSHPIFFMDEKSTLYLPKLLVIFETSPIFPEVLPTMISFTPMLSTSVPETLIKLLVLSVILTSNLISVETPTILLTSDSPILYPSLT